MKEITFVELYKMWKRKYFFIILIFNSISIFYGLGILLNWSWVSFHGTFDLIQYMGAIWQLLFLIGLPLIFFMYIASNILGGEMAEGQILLEVTRVADRRKLVMAKVLAVFLLVVFYFGTNVIISIVSYSLFVRQTSFVTLEWMILDRDNIQLVIISLFGLIYIVFSIFLSMFLSIRNGAVAATIAGVALYAAMSLLTRIPGICIFVPSYFALRSNVKMEAGSVIQQILWCSFIIGGFLYLIRKKFSNIDL